MKRFFLYIILISFVFNGIADAEPSRPDIAARAAIVIDLDKNEVIYSKNPDEKLLPASTAKLATALVAFENAGLDNIAFVSSKAAATPSSRINLQRGDILTRGSLLKAALLASANDASVALAENIAPTEQEFVKRMNLMAAKAGAINSKFVNSHGLPLKGQYTTVRDLSIIVKRCITYPRFTDIMKKADEKIKIYHPQDGAMPADINKFLLANRSTMAVKEVKLKTKNRFLWQYPGMVIGKTGFTKAAGHCYAGYAVYGGKRVIVALLKSKKPVWADLNRLLDYAFGLNTVLLDPNNNIVRDTRNIQILLKKAGFNPGPIDGIKGPKTRAAIRKFQGQNNLKPTGVVDGKAWKKLKRFF
ncbi:MAG: peptidoglycan-binding protein [Candidatus Aureabacteria bacterium]|nr:peptidoglycan-binding protein [Candidatus Auribacterota bacterium]